LDSSLRVSKRIVTRGLPSQTHYIGSQCVSPGRESSSDIRIVAEGVSRTRAQITRKGKEYCICDLQSTNGTSVNGRGIHPETRLRHGDTSGPGGTVVLQFDKPHMSP